MKILGVIGGIGPESTIEYYRLLIALCRGRQADGNAPQIIVNSIDNQRMLGLIAAGDLAAVTKYLLHEIGRLAAAGAELGLLAANTPHLVFDEVQAGSPIPLVSIVEATLAAAETLGIRRAGLFGTRFTMQGTFYPAVFNRTGIALVIPGVEEQDYIHDKYMGELLHGVFLPETRHRLLGIADRLREQEGIDGLILGGTELPLILREPSHGGIPLLNTTEIHVKAAVARMAG